MRNWKHVLEKKNGRTLFWAARKWSKYENKLGDRIIKQLLNSVIAKYRDLSASRNLMMICLSLRLRHRNKWYAHHWQITIFCSTSSNNWLLNVANLRLTKLNKDKRRAKKNGIRWCILFKLLINRLFYLSAIIENRWRKWFIKRKIGVTKLPRS